MHQAELERRQERARRETLVIRQIEEGYRVYSPTNPANAYVVSGTVDDPTCSCPDFQGHENDPEWRCKHILAVFPETSSESQSGNGRNESRGEHPPSSSNEVAQDPVRGHRANGTRQMVLKRSVSPDGRIDSLSVELSYPLEGSQREEIRRRAHDAIGLQKAIVDDFLGRSGGNGRPATEATQAQLLNAGGMDTRWGRRLFLTFQVNGQRLRLFGSPRHLADAIAAAGYPEMADSVVEGTQFNVPCRVTTKPSEDGRYTNVDRIFPANGTPGNRRWRQ